MHPDNKILNQNYCFSLFATCIIREWNHYRLRTHVASCNVILLILLSVSGTVKQVHSVYKTHTKTTQYHLKVQFMVINLFNNSNEKNIELMNVMC